MSEKVKSTTVVVTKDNFNSIVESNKPILLDFWAEWCMPCRMLGPIVEKLAEKYGDDVVIGKVNVDVEQELGGYFQVRSIPNVMIIKDKKVLHNMVGVRPEGDYTEILDSLISENN
ncbi:MAG: thioredoxin [Clostridia bacterium]|nr:thioredoxin [Clostridia bacterium]MBN2884104.1 thioredoxin [Clostridia bacterium]